MPRKSELGLNAESTEKLGRAIMVRRAVLRMDRVRLAEKASLSYPYIHQLETGARTPSTEALIKVATALGMTDVDLLTLADSMPSVVEIETVG